MIKGKFGWDPVIKVCWLTSDTPADRLIWQISTQLFWILLAVVVTALSAVITMAYLYKHRVPFPPTLDASWKITHSRELTVQFKSDENLQATEEDQAARPPTPPKNLQGIPRLDAHGRPVDMDLAYLGRNATKYASRKLSGTKRFRSVIFRICMDILLGCSWGLGLC